MSEEKVLEMQSLKYENKKLKDALSAWADHMRSVRYGGSEWTNVHFERASQLTEDCKSILDE